jgi:hypothetical protein
LDTRSQRYGEDAKSAGKPGRFGIDQLAILFSDITEGSAIVELLQSDDVDGGMDGNGREASQIRCLTPLVMLEVPADTQYFIPTNGNLSMGQTSSKRNWSMTLLAPRFVRF